MRDTQPHHMQHTPNTNTLEKRNGIGVSQRYICILHMTKSSHMNVFQIKRHKKVYKKKTGQNCSKNKNIISLSFFFTELKLLMGLTFNPIFFRAQTHSERH